MKILKSTIFCLALFSSEILFATIPPITGQLVIINSLSDVTDVTSRSPIMIQIYDTQEPGIPCFTLELLYYDGVSITKWDANGVHGPTSCAGTGIGSASISKVEITPMVTVVGNTDTIVYDDTPNSSVPTRTANTITYIPPTTFYENMVLIINGIGIPATFGQAADATNWGFTVAPTIPIFNAITGALITTGVPGLISTYGFRAEQLMKQYGITPHHSGKTVATLFNVS